MFSRLRPEQREHIEKRSQEGLRPHEIATEMGIDTRTVKHYLDVRPLERIPDLIKQQEILEHWKNIRSLCEALKKELNLPPPENIDVIQLPPVGEIVFSFEHAVVRWKQANDGSYNLKLPDKKYDCLIEHLRTSRQKRILNALERWKRTGGDLLKDCHDLRLAIRSASETRTWLSTIPENIVEGNIVRSNIVEGLLESFSWTIYSYALSGTKEPEYKITSKHKDLRLLHLSPHNLAWVKGRDIGRIRDIHQELIRRYQGLPNQGLPRLHIVGKILDEKRWLKRDGESLSQQLDNFAERSVVIPGKCSQCPK
jgi:hypothetical protein